MKNFLKITNTDKLIFIIISLFPLSFICGNAIINSLIALSLLSFLINLKDNIFLIKEKINLLLIFFLFATIVNLTFSLYPLNSIYRVFKIFLIVCFIFEFRRIFIKLEFQNLNLIFKIWTITFSVVLIDVIFEILFGFNTIGNFTTLEGRIAGFFGDELVAGAFIHAFGLLFISYLISLKKNNFLIFSVILILIITSFLIGERSNFIKFLSITIIFYFFIIKMNFLKKISIIGIFIISLTAILNFNEEYKYRYISQIEVLYKKDGFLNFFKESKYGAHQNAAFKIFNDYPFFGIGIKNFRIESSNKKYENKEYLATEHRQATHPHQIHLEILSETGLFGYLSFLILIITAVIISYKSYKKNQNYYQLASILYIVSSLYPIIPSGSVFSTFGGGLFWFNFALMISLNNLKKIKY